MIHRLVAHDSTAKNSNFLVKQFTTIKKFLICAKTSTLFKLVFFLRHHARRRSHWPNKGRSHYLGAFRVKSKFLFMKAIIHYIG